MSDPRMSLSDTVVTLSPTRSCLCCQTNASYAHRTDRGESAFARCEMRLPRPRKSTPRSPGNCARSGHRLLYPSGKQFAARWLGILEAR
jgi:hypothetical protein